MSVALKISHMNGKQRFKRLICQTYLGRTMDFSNAFALCTRMLTLASALLPHMAKSVEGAAPGRFQPMYAGANMGHPSSS